MTLKVIFFLSTIIGVFPDENPVTRFPLVNFDESEVNLAFHDLAKSQNHFYYLQKFISEMNVRFGKDEICGTDEIQKIFFCAFVLQNAPYSLSLNFQNNERIKCHPHQFVLDKAKGGTFKSTILLYRCPEIDHVMYEMENNINAVYYVSRAKEKKSALFYIQNNANENIWPHSIVSEVDFEELERMKNAKIVSNDGKLYVSVIWDHELAKEKQIAYQNGLIPTVYQEFEKPIELFEICHLQYRQLIFLCDQAVKHYDLRKQLNMHSFTKTECVELQLNFYVYECPPVISAVNENNGLTITYDITYYISGSAEIATVILYCRKPEKSFEACAVIHQIDLQVLNRLKDAAEEDKPTEAEPRPSATEVF